MTNHIASGDLFRDLRQLKLWEARHSFVLQFIEQHDIRNMIDFGCSEGTLLQKIQRGTHIQNLIGVDIDDQILEKAVENNNRECIQQQIAYNRNYDQLVQIYKGSVLQKYSQFQKIKLDLVTFIQVIQHMQQKYTPLINQNIFGYLKPQYVILSTPNCQFNSLFKWENKMFRHDDHKFQWSRNEFRKYVDDACDKYGYEVEVTGLGLPLLPQNDKLGYCTQIAIFKKKSLIMLDQTHLNEDEITFQRMNKFNKKTVQIPGVPLNLIKRHINHSWISIKQDLIKSAFGRLEYQCKQNGYLSWDKSLKFLRKQKIIKKIIQNDDNFQYQFQMKKFVFQKISQYNLKIFCSDGGLQIVNQITQISYNKSLDQEFSQFSIQKSQKDIFKEENDEIIREQGVILYNYENYEPLLAHRRSKVQKSKKSSSNSQSNKSSRSQKNKKSKSSSSKSSSWGQVQFNQDEIKMKRQRVRHRGNRQYRRNQKNEQQQHLKITYSNQQSQIQKSVSQNLNQISRYSSQQSFQDRG